MEYWIFLAPHKTLPEIPVVLHETSHTGAAARENPRDATAPAGWGEGKGTPQGQVPGGTGGPLAPLVLCLPGSAASAIWEDTLRVHTAPYMRVWGLVGSPVHCSALLSEVTPSAGL